MTVGSKFRIALVGVGEYATQNLRNSIGLRIIQRYAAKTAKEDVSSKVDFSLERDINSYIATLDNNRFEFEAEICLVQQNQLFNASGTNLSGGMVKNLLKKHDIHKRNLIVCHDCMLCPVGRYKMRTYGKKYKHQSLISIRDTLKTDQFHSFGFGIGRQGIKLKDQQNFRASPFDEEELPVVEDMLDLACMELDKHIKKKKKAWEVFNGKK